MVDQELPTNQFHPYTPETSTPHTDRVSSGGLKGMMDKVGLNSSSLKNVNINGARDYARANPGKVLGGLAALVIGAGLLQQRGRMMSKTRGTGFPGTI